VLALLSTGSAFATNYTLTLYTNGSGTISKNPTNSSYPSGVTVTITATPNAGWYFANWSGDTNSTVNPLNVTMNSNMVVTGNFVAYPNYSVALTTNGQGGIALSPPGGIYLSNTVVTATATPAAGWVFVAWLGTTNTAANPVSLTVNTNISLLGLFAQLPAFDVEPNSVTNQPGSTVSFTSHSVGTTPLGYNWYFSGGTLTNATNATLTLTNVTSAQAGNYWAVATNNYGSATSSVVSLTLTNPIGSTNVVTSPDQGSLQAAIALGGWVGIGFNGTLLLTNTINITNNVVLDGTGVAATISGGNAVQLFNVAQGASLTISNLTLANGSCISAIGSADGGAIYNNGAVTLVGCSLTNNSALSQMYGGLARGGAIFNNGGTVFVLGSSLFSNSVSGGFTANSYGQNGGFGYGGAVFNTNGSLSLVNSILRGNLCKSAPGDPNAGASWGGAAFEASGSLTLTSCNFSSNQVVGGNGGSAAGGGNNGCPAYGGAVAVQGGNVSINRSQFFANAATGGNTGFNGSGSPAFGGAIYSATTLAINDCSFFGNKAVAGSSTDFHTAGGVDGLGGAIYNAGNAVVNRCLICSNVAQGGYIETYSGFDAATGFRGLGGGIFNASQFFVTNCTVALNMTVGGGGDGTSIAISGNAIGGGVFNNAGAVFVGMNLTIASNSCSSPAGVQLTNGFAAGFQIGNSNGTLRVHNTLIAYSGTNSNAYGPITDDGYNISSDGSAALFSGSSYNYTDPQLAPLGNYGGPTLCMALLASSPAIDNGDGNGAPNVDQRGYSRPFGSGVDMGAYEYGALPPPPSVAIGASGSNVQISFTADPPNTYFLQYSTNLVTWINLSTNGPVSSQTNINQTISKQGYGHCYFRLLVQ